MPEATHITSSHNERLKRLGRLQSRRGRKQLGRTAVYGLREILRAYEGQVPIEELWLSDETWQQVDSAWLASLQATGTELMIAPAKLLSALPYADRSDYGIGVIRLQNRRLDEIHLGENPCVAIIERVEKPGNLGAILRSADGAGIGAVIIVDAATDLMNPNAIRASMGTVFSVPNCVTSLDELIPWVRRHGLQVVTTRVDATDLFYEADLTVPTAIVLGSEAHGLGEHWRDLGEHAVRLPMFGVADSLNVSATAAVLFYELLRQRQVARLS